MTKLDRIVSFASLLQQTDHTTVEWSLFIMLASAMPSSSVVVLKRPVLGSLESLSSVLPRIVKIAAERIDPM